jgi:ADP-ribose pyrophosphatase
MKTSSKEKTLYAGKHIRLVQQGQWEFARRTKASGIVMIAAVTADGKLLLIEQLRPPVGKRVIELPAGLAGDVAGTRGGGARGRGQARTRWRRRVTRPSR